MVPAKTKKTNKKLKRLLQILIVLGIFALGISLGNFINKKDVLPNKFKQDQIKENQYTAFITESFNIIQENYWDKISEDQLINLYKLAVEKQTAQPLNLKETNLSKFIDVYLKIIDSLETDEQKKELTTTTVDMVLANLKPFGRSRLYTQQLEEQLKNTVQNINPDIDHYQTLEVDKNAPQEIIDKKYQAIAEEYGPKVNESTEAAQKLNQAERAYEVLKDEETRQVYDVSGVEPTMSYNLIRPSVLHIHMTKVSPTSLDDIQRITDKVNDRPELNTLILDLRDNIGGAIDLLPYFLGPFIGQDQYAYQFYHQGDKTDFKTKTGWMPTLVRYKKVVVLINENTQSSAELIASTLKKYNVGIVMGTTSKGWGTIEKVIPMDKQLDTKEKFSIFLVHHLSLRDDGQPVEGNGVIPVIDINSSNWEQQLNEYFNYPELTSALKEIYQF
jgi:hypothetical protein